MEDDILAVLMYENNKWQPYVLHSGEIVAIQLKTMDTEIEALNLVKMLYPDVKFVNDEELKKEILIRVSRLGGNGNNVE